MTAALLDVNVLVALAWPTHVHHALAQSWFGQRGRAAWATCPATQAGFVRVVSNPAISPDALAPAQAFEYLGQLVTRPGHVFWADDESLVGSRFIDPRRLQGYRQVSDAHLLAIARRHGGALATLDRGIRALLPTEAPPGSVVLLSP